MDWISHPNRVHNIEDNSTTSTNEYPMLETKSYQKQRLTNVEYCPINSSSKLKLLLQRSLRYSYRQRCCRCIPTILCELLFPLILMILITLARYGTNALDKEIKKDPTSIPTNFNHPQCSQDMNKSITLSKDLLTKCFQFPSSYKHDSFISHSTNIIFQPKTNYTNQLVQHAKARLTDMNCSFTQVE